MVRLPLVFAIAALGVVSPNGCRRSGTAVVDPGLPDGTQLATEVVASGFDTIWELAWGPDGAIWVTERPGIITRVNPGTGSKTKVADIAVSESGEGGLMGLTFHPDFSTQPWVYLAHTYSVGNNLRNRVVRLRWDGTSLGPPQVLVDNIPGSSIHNGSRVVVGPDRLLYVTTGDASNGSSAQDRNSLAGKILRLTLDGAPAPGNPFGTLVYSFGHRNPQGLVFAPSGALYETEHGPSDNDELNRIESGRNFGWPDVHGKCDGDTGSNEIPFCQANNVVEPLANWTPTIATTGLAWYDGTRFPAWRGSLFFTTLKGAALYRISLSADGRAVTGQEKFYEGDFGRLRDVLVAPDGAIYLGTSNKDGRGSPFSSDDRIIRITTK